MGQKLDIQRLASTVREVRGATGLRATAEIIGISFPTLSRIEQGKVPDLNTYIKICEWLKVDVNTFVLGDKQQVSREDRIIAHLRSDRQLNPKAAATLEEMIKLVYNSTKE